MGLLPGRNQRHDHGGPGCSHRQSRTVHVAWNCFRGFGCRRKLRKSIDVCCWSTEGRRHRQGGHLRQVQHGVDEGGEDYQREGVCFQVNNWLTIIDLIFYLNIISL